ncbi:MAG: GNAT family N-acetyltransferase [Omnitrophica bacterium RIFCSPHIGHO2_02_FULL_51_18]|nr:MAG: GNAT family N-acetyltransferase [Omnitrophica bacterium RIFCSPHIGHO2_02_FULL_51_18]
MPLILNDRIEKTPWDSHVFGIETYEIKTLNQGVMDEVLKAPGHYTIKVHPLSSKKILHDNGFYYCDTLIEPYCSKRKFVKWEDAQADITQKMPLKDLLKISHGSYLHGRFHRDFNIDPKLADVRYDNWLKELYGKGRVLSLIYAGELAGFFAYSGNKILLHALGAKHQGRGLAKFLWSAACDRLFAEGHEEITSSISAINSAALNLYISLGFRFRNSCDVYHRLVT